MGRNGSISPWDWGVWTNTQLPGKSQIYCARGKWQICMVERISCLPACKKHPFSIGKDSPVARGEIPLITTHLLLSGTLRSALLWHGASQLQQMETKRGSTQLLRLPFFHAPRNVTAAEQRDVAVLLWMQCAGVQWRLTAAETTCAHLQLGKHLLRHLRMVIPVVTSIFLTPHPRVMPLFSGKGKESSFLNCEYQSPSNEFTVCKMLSTYQAGEYHGAMLCPVHITPILWIALGEGIPASGVPLREKTSWQVSVLSCSYLIYCESHLFWFRQCW